MACPCAPPPTLRSRPRGRQRTARGRCGSLLLHRNGLAPSTPCRSPGAREAKQSISRQWERKCGLLRRFAPRNDDGERGGLLRRLLGFAEVSLVSELDSIFQRGARAPAQFGKAADIEQFARGAVRPRGVEADLAGISAGRATHAREFRNRDVLAGADVDQSFAGIILYQV